MEACGSLDGRSLIFGLLLLTIAMASSGISSFSLLSDFSSVAVSSHYVLSVNLGDGYFWLQQSCVLVLGLQMLSSIVHLSLNEGFLTFLDMT